MSDKMLASLAVATMLGAALIAFPAQAQRGHGGGGFGGGGGFHGGFGGGGFHGAAVGGFGGGGMRAGVGPGFGGGGFRTAAIGSGFAGRPGFVGRPGFAGGAGWWGGRTAWGGGRGGWWGGRRWPFFGVGVGLGLAGLYAASYSSCWNWVPTAFGWQQVWTCGGYDTDFYGPNW